MFQAKKKTWLQTLIAAMTIGQVAPWRLPTAQTPLPDMGTCSSTLLHWSGNADGDMSASYAQRAVN